MNGWNPDATLLKQIELDETDRLIESRRNVTPVITRIQAELSAKGLLRSGLYLQRVDKETGDLESSRLLGGLTEAIRLFGQFSQLDDTTGAWLRSRFERAVDGARKTHETRLADAIRSAGMRAESFKGYGSNTMDTIASKGRRQLDAAINLAKLTARATLPTSTLALEEKFQIVFAIRGAKAEFDRVPIERPLALLFLDIDRFKNLNSLYSETTVDRCILIPFQRTLKVTVDGRGAVFRHGGEEFVVLLPNCDLTESQAFGERLVREIAQNRFDVEGVEVAVTISAGLAARGVHGSSYEEVLTAANGAENIAKKAGRNQLQVSPPATRAGASPSVAPLSATEGETSTSGAGAQES